MTRKLNIDNGLQGQMKENQAVTKVICNKGFSGNSSFLPRSNFGVGGQGSTRNPLLHIVSSVIANSSNILQTIVIKTD